MQGSGHDTAGSSRDPGCVWSARFETVIGPERPYVPRNWLMSDIARVAAQAGMPTHACVVAAIRVCGEPDQTRAPGWPFVDRRVTLVLFADRPAAGCGAPASTRAMGYLGWRRAPWTDDEATAWAHAIGADAHTLMAGSDYDEAVWGTPMAAYMVAVRDHAKLGRPRPARPATLGTGPHGRTVIVGWLGSTALADSAEGLALHLGTWPIVAGSNADNDECTLSNRALGSLSKA